MTHHDNGSDPKLVIRARLKAALGAAFGAEHTDIDPDLRESKFADIDLQANGVLSLARVLREQPRRLAERLVAELDVADLATVEVAGPGYLNFRLHDQWIAQRVQEVLADQRRVDLRRDGPQNAALRWIAQRLQEMLATLWRADRPLTVFRLGVAVSGAPQTVVVDYSSPNVAKDMHVGHLRTTVVGDAIVRCLEFLGHRVVRINHIGDWGTQFGMLVEYLLDQQSTDWGDSQIGDLTALYKAAKKRYDADEDFAVRSRERVVQLQAGDPETLQVWRGLVATSMEYFNRVYRRLGVTLTDGDIRGESFYNEMLAPMAEYLEETGHAVLSDGALCVFPDGFVNRERQPQPFIVRKGDGGFGYAATDLVAIRHRVEELQADRIVYVVGAPQAQHFEMLFAVARQIGWLPDGVTVQHAQIGNVLGEDGKILRTRAGKTVKLMDLLDEAEQRAAAEYDGVSREAIKEKTRSRIVEAVGIGAVKFADLRVARDRGYTYNPDRMARFQGGNTGPYLQYQGARIRSIFRMAGLKPKSANGPVKLGDPKERALAVRLLGFGVAVKAVADTNKPSVLADYLNEVAADYSAFYQDCRILDAPDPETKASRLALCAATLRTLETGLVLLGIRPLERM